MKRDCRSVVIAGNWKMNCTPKQAQMLIEQLKPLAEKAPCEVVVCVPFVDLPAVIESTRGSAMHVGAQNCHWEDSGAFTGEISAQMLKELGVEYVILGHSERRQYFGETDQTVNQRLCAALKAGLRPILCVGEVLTQREQGITEEVVRQQTKIALQGIRTEDMKRIIIAYEPVWAIGTGKTATAEQADEVCGQIRQVLASLYGEATAQETTIQYGGSMKPSNARELLHKENVDGGLIGGASLKAEEFAAICCATQE